MKHSRRYLIIRGSVRVLFWGALSLSIFGLAWLSASIYAAAIGWHAH